MIDITDKNIEEIENLKQISREGPYRSAFRTLGGPGLQSRLNLHPLLYSSITYARPTYKISTADTSVIYNMRCGRIFIFRAGVVRFNLTFRYNCYVHRTK